MFHGESYQLGVGLSPLQAEYREQYMRPGSREVRSGRIRRPFVSIAALAPRRANGGGGRHLGANLRKNTVLPMSQLEFVTLSDCLSEQGSGRLRVGTRVMMQQPYLQAGCVPVVGGSQRYCRLKIDFSRGPLSLGQAELMCRSHGTLQSPVAGTLRIQHYGDYVDICVGEYDRGAGKVPQIVWRLPIEPFRTNSIQLLEGTLPEEPGDLLEFDTVKAGQALVCLLGQISYGQAVFRDGRPVLERPRGRRLLASKLDYFSALNSMNQQQNDLVLLPEDQQPSLTDPAEWAFRVLFEVRHATVTEDGQQVVIDPYNLLTFPGFMPTPALAGDILQAVGLDGDLQAVAEQAGAVRAIESRDGEKLVVFNSGAVQRVPGSAPLLKGDRPLQAGDHLSKGEPLGDLVPRKDYRELSWLANAAGGLESLVHVFLSQTSIKRGPTVLYDWAYLPQALVSHLPVAAGDLESAYFDFSRGEDYYLPAARGYVFPPIRTLDEFDDVVLFVGRVQFDLSEPVGAPETETVAEQMLVHA